MNKKYFRPMAALCLALCLMLSGAVRVSAGSYEPCWLEIPFSVEDVSRVIPQDTSFVVEIEADGKAPLPEKSQVETETEGSYSIDRITFDQPGTYTYSLSIRKTGDEGEGTDGTVVADSSVYRLTVSVFARDDASLHYALEVFQDGSSLKTDDTEPMEAGSFRAIVFRNRFARPGDGQPDNSGSGGASDGTEDGGKDGTGKGGGGAVGTGETDWRLPAFGGLLVGFVLLLVCVWRLRRRRAADAKEADGE